MIVYYSGEVQMEATDSSEICEYYNAYIALDTDSRILNEV